jgi:hypothetical protein
MGDLTVESQNRSTGWNDRDHVDVVRTRTVLDPVDREQSRHKRS